MCHNLEWKLGQIQKYANTHHVWGLKSREISFAFAKWEEVGKVFLTNLVNTSESYNLKPCRSQNSWELLFLESIFWKKYLQNVFKINTNCLYFHVDLLSLFIGEPCLPFLPDESFYPHYDSLTVDRIFTMTKNVRQLQKYPGCSDKK